MFANNADAISLMAQARDAAYRARRRVNGVQNRKAFEDARQAFYRARRLARDLRLAPWLF